MNEGFSRGTGTGDAAFAKQKIELLNKVKQLGSQDLYTRLGVTSRASEEEIRSSLRQFAQFHPGNKPPELQPVYEEIFKLYTEAVSTLKNPQSRAKYDSTRAYTSPRENASYRNPTPTQQSKPKTSPERPSSATEEQRARDAAWNRIVSSLEGMGADSFVRSRDEAVAKKLFSVEQINRHEFVRMSATRSLLNALEREAETFVRRRDEWVRAGVYTKSDINRDPRVRAAALNDITNSLMYGIESFGRKKDAWIEAGVFTKQEIISNQTVLNFAQKDISNSLIFGAESFKRKRDAWNKQGIFDANFINRQPAVRNHAWQEIKEMIVHGPESYAKRRDAWVEAGVFTMREINLQPAVKKYAEAKVLSKSLYTSESRRRVANEWVRVGVLSEKEANTLLSASR